MPVPKKKHSRSRQGKRRANWKLSLINVISCPQCHSPMLPHNACSSCGQYEGRQVIKIKEEKAEEKAKKEEKKAKKEEKKAKEKTSIKGPAKEK